MAEDGDTGVDGMGAGESGAATAAGLALAAVHQQLELDVPLLAGAGAVVPHGRAVGPDRRQQDAPDLRVQPPVIVRR
jgi:leucyl aminopeptidase